MTVTAPRHSHVRNPRSLFIGGAWIDPSSSAKIDVLDSTTEEVFLTVAEAQATDVERAVAAARKAFDAGPWPRMTPGERGVFLNKIADAWETRSEALADTWASESGTLRSMSIHSAKSVAAVFRYYAGLGEAFAWEEKHISSMGKPALLVREPVGVVAAIIPWNAPHSLMSYKAAAALIAGCTIILKASPEAPAAPYFLAEICEEVGLARGRRQRADGRPRSVRTAGSQPGHRQGQFYRIDRRGAQNRFDLRRAYRARHVGAGRQIACDYPG